MNENQLQKQSGCHRKHPPPSPKSPYHWKSGLLDLWQIYETNETYTWNEWRIVNSHLCRIDFICLSNVCHILVWGVPPAPGVKYIWFFYESNAKCRWTQRFHIYFIHLFRYASKLTSLFETSTGEMRVRLFTCSCCLLCVVFCCTGSLVNHTPRRPPKAKCDRRMSIIWNKGDM